MFVRYIGILGLSLMMVSASAHAAETASATVSIENEKQNLSQSKRGSASKGKDWDKPIKGFHPIKRLVRPVWKLKREAQELQDDRQWRSKRARRQRIGSMNDQAFAMTFALSENR